MTAKRLSNPGSMPGFFYMGAPAGRTYLEVKVLHQPGKGNG